MARKRILFERVLATMDAEVHGGALKCSEFDIVTQLTNVQCLENVFSHWRGLEMTYFLTYAPHRYHTTFAISQYQLEFRTVNAARSAFGCFTFGIEFFELYATPGIQGNTQTVEETGIIRCKVLNKVYFCRSVQSYFSSLAKQFSNLSTRSTKLSRNAE